LEQGNACCWQQKKRMLLKFQKALEKAIDVEHRV
jgi:hypothetical protein